MAMDPGTLKTGATALGLDLLVEALRWLLRAVGSGNANA